MKQAIDHYDREGGAATLAFYNSGESVDGEWYVFIVDENGITIAHAIVPDNLGQSIYGSLGVDSTGYAFGPVIGSATEDGLWVEYCLPEPGHGRGRDKAFLGRQA